MNNDRMNFINKITPIILLNSIKFCCDYPSAIIALACFNSKFGTSDLYKRSFNIFKVKSNNYWLRYNPSSFITYVNKETKEQIKYKTYNNDEESIINFFEHLQKPKFSSLDECTSLHEYIITYLNADDQLLTNDSKIEQIINMYGLRYFDNPQSVCRKIWYDSEVYKRALYSIFGKYGSGMKRKRQLSIFREDIENLIEKIS